MSNKLRKKDIREDDFQKAVVETTGQAMAVVKGHRLAIIGGAVAVVAIAVVAGVVTSRARTARERSEAALASALRKLDEATTPDPSKAPPTWSEVADALAAVQKDHAGTPAARLAEHWAGVAALRSGDASAAATTLARVVEASPEAWTTPHAMAGLAAAQEDAGKIEEAAATLQKLADGDWPGYPKAAALYGLARFHERHGNADAARKAYDQLATDSAFAESSYAAQAKAALERLGKS